MQLARGPRDYRARRAGRLRGAVARGRRSHRSGHPLQELGSGLPPLCPLIASVAKLGSAMKRDARRSAGRAPSRSRCVSSSVLRARIHPASTPQSGRQHGTFIVPRRCPGRLRGGATQWGHGDCGTGGVTLILAGELGASRGGWRRGFTPAERGGKRPVRRPEGCRVEVRVFE